MTVEPTSEPDLARPRRRELFVAAGAAAVAGVAGWAVGASSRADSGHDAPTPSSDAAPAALPLRDQRPGITAPAVPQRHALVTVVDLDAQPTAVRDRVRAALAAPRPTTPDAGDVTLTVGFGARLAGALWPERATGDLGVPRFAKDTADLRAGGDLVLQTCAETAAGAQEASRVFLDALGPASVRWSQLGTRDAPTPAGTTRTPSGFVDGIVNPRTPEELADGVWAPGSHRDTYAVFRRMRVHPSFGDLDVAAQERAIGRRRDDGAPLSGGGPMAQVDLFAKSADGRLLTPTDSHARRAHPANLRRSLMLRRSYAWDPGEGMGLVFIAFMNDPQTFVATQRRLDEADGFLAHSSADAVGMFFVPSGLDG